MGEGSDAVQRVRAGWLESGDHLDVARPRVSSSRRRSRAEPLMDSALRTRFVARNGRLVVLVNNAGRIAPAVTATAPRALPPASSALNLRADRCGGERANARDAGRNPRASVIRENIASVRRRAPSPDHRWGTAAAKAWPAERGADGWEIAFAPNGARPTQLWSASSYTEHGALFYGDEDGIAAVRRHRSRSAGWPQPASG
jgi:hypothetical protein